MTVSIIIVGLFVVLAGICAMFFNTSYYLARFVGWRLLNKGNRRQGYVYHEGAQIHYTIFGESDEVVLLLHGGLSHHGSWFCQVPDLVEAGKQLVLVDTRGHGNSTEGNLPLSYQLYAEDALAVMDQLAIATVDVVGWSDGGNTALVLSLVHPTRVKRVITLSANYQPDGLTLEAQQQNAQRDGLLAAWAKRVWTRSGVRYPVLENRLKQLWSKAPLLSHEQLSLIISPTLVIAGEKDIIRLTHSESLARCLQTGYLVIVPNAGHHAQMTHPHAINSKILNFLSHEMQ